MKYVLDSNVALKWVLAEPDSAKAKQLRDDFQNALHELLAPDVFEVAAVSGLAVNPLSDTTKILRIDTGGLNHRPPSHYNETAPPGSPASPSRRKELAQTLENGAKS